MLHEVEFSKFYLVPDANRTKRSIVNSLMMQLLEEKSSEQHGYYLAITKLESIGEGEVQSNPNMGTVAIPVVFRCRMFLPVIGETLEGIVYAVKTRGVMIKCGPTKNVYLSAQKMPGYNLVTGDVRYFQNDRLDRIERGVVVRFMVLSVKWVENRPGRLKREFLMLASLETGESFGPVSLPGFDNSDI
ncbi:unnamed protein product [Rhodiola kirilowii]